MRHEFDLHHSRRRSRVVPFPQARTRPRRRAGAAAFGLVVALGAAIGFGAAELGLPWSWPAGDAAVAPVAHFGFCRTGGGNNCVVDGDTFWMHGERIRIADIDAPETHPPRCAEEARLGKAATERLQALLNAGPVTLAEIDRDSDRYGRKLRVVLRNGKSLGEMLVAEGLARRWEGQRRPWCT